MSTTRWMCALTCLALSGCGETRIVQGTSESAATGEPWHAEVPSLDMSTEPAVSLVDEPDSGAAAPAAGMGGGLAGIGGGTPEPNEPIELPPPLDVEPASDAGVGVVDAAVVQSEVQPEVSELAPQIEVCGADMSCDFKCTSAACAMSCDDANKCKVDCGEDSTTCDVSCRGANNCEPKCRSGSCDFDCTDANNCDHLRCEDGAECLALCAGADNCKWEECDEPAECAGDVIVCNRACPAE